MKTTGSLQHILQEASSWHLPPSTTVPAGNIDAGKLFREYCATCHNPEGEVRVRWGSEFHPLPPELNASTLDKIDDGKKPAQLRTRLARIIKFGMPGTNMPGHEYMPDPQVEALADYLATRRMQER